MKQLTVNIEGKALDWALAKAMGHAVAVCYGCIVGVQDESGSWQAFAGHTDHATCLKLIKENIYRVTATHGGWEVFGDDGQRRFSDTSLEEAVARCVVAMRLGDEVEVPDELVGERA